MISSTATWLLSFGSRAFHISAPKIWNSAHSAISNSLFLTSFKDLLLSIGLSRSLAAIHNAPWFSSETLALYKLLTYLLTYLLNTTVLQHSAIHCTIICLSVGREQWIHFRTIIIGIEIVSTCCLDRTLNRQYNYTAFPFMCSQITGNNFRYNAWYDMSRTADVITVIITWALTLALGRRTQSHVVLHYFSVFDVSRAKYRR